MAGWEPYLQHLQVDPVFKSGGIYGQDGSVWVQSADLKSVSAEEIKNIATGDEKAFRVAGPKFNGDKYMYLQNAEAKYGFKHHVMKKGPASLLAINTTKAVVIMITKDGANVANADKHAWVAQQLKNAGF